MQMSEAERATLLAAADVLDAIGERERYQIEGDPCRYYSTRDGYLAGATAYVLRRRANEATV
jgi:hypothetical protein